MTSPSQSGGSSIAAQVEQTGDGAIVRWIEPDLQAGASKTYHLVADRRHATPARSASSTATAGATWLTTTRASGGT